MLQVSDLTLLSHKAEDYVYGYFGGMIRLPSTAIREEDACLRED